MFSLLNKLLSRLLLATVVVGAAVLAYGIYGRKAHAHAEYVFDARPHCYQVDYQHQPKLWVGTKSSVGNSRICVPGAPGTREVVGAIQSQLQTAARSSDKHVTAVITNILPAKES